MIPFLRIARKLGKVGGGGGDFRAEFSFLTADVFSFSSIMLSVELWPHRVFVHFRLFPITRILRAEVLQRRGGGWIKKMIEGLGYAFSNRGVIT